MNFAYCGHLLRSLSSGKQTMLKENKLEFMNDWRCLSFFIWQHSLLKDSDFFQNLAIFSEIRLEDEWPNKWNSSELIPGWSSTVLSSEAFNDNRNKGEISILKVSHYCVYLLLEKNVVYNSKVVQCNFSAIFVSFLVDLEIQWISIKLNQFLFVEFVRIFRSKQTII